MAVQGNLSLCQAAPEGSVEASRAKFAAAMVAATGAGWKTCCYNHSKEQLMLVDGC